MGYYSVTLETLKSKLHNVKAIEKGIELWKRDKVAFEHIDGNEFRAQIADKNEIRIVFLAFSSDGCDVERHYCHCRPGRDGAICKHIVATVLAVQGGIVDTNITLGRTASVRFAVTEKETAQFARSGSVGVLATSALIAHMERAACAALKDGLAAGQTSVGTSINVAHTAASVVGMEVTATATIISIAGRKINFELIASDEAGEIGSGMHTRIIVETDAFFSNAKERKF